LKKKDLIFPKAAVATAMAATAVATVIVVMNCLAVIHRSLKKIIYNHCVTVLPGIQMVVKVVLHLLNQTTIVSY
jgi:hypothetical protein